MALQGTGSIPNPCLIPIARREEKAPAPREIDGERSWTGYSWQEIV